VNCVRDMTLADVPAVARTHADAWQAAYTGLLPASYLAARTYEERVQRWTDLMALPELRRLVCEADGRVVGFAACQRNGRDVEVMTLYVHPTQWRRGHGAALLTAVKAMYPGQRLFLWALKTHVDALAFYREQGFRPTGRSQVDQTCRGQEVVDIEVAFSPTGDVT
jgi:N-acetylglutamate synthase-like GNAT family acetyltransferase